MRRGGQFGAEAGAAIGSRGMRRRAKKPGGLLLIQPGTEHFLIRPGSGHFLLPLGQLCKARCRPFHQFPQLALLGFFFHGAGWQGFGTTFPDRHRPQGAVSGSRLGQAARGRVLAPRGGAAPGRRRRHPRPPSRRPRPRACRASRRGARAGCRRTDRDAPCPPPAFPPIELACGAPARPSGRGAAKAARRMREAAARLPGSPRNAGASGRARACPSGRYRAGRGLGCGKSRLGRAARPAEPGPGRPPPPRAGPGPGLLPWRSAPRKSIAAPIFPRAARRAASPPRRRRARTAPRPPRQAPRGTATGASARTAASRCRPRGPRPARPARGVCSVRELADAGASGHHARGSFVLMGRHSGASGAAFFLGGQKAAGDCALFLLAVRPRAPRPAPAAGSATLALTGSRRRITSAARPRPTGRRRAGGQRAGGRGRPARREFRHGGARRARRGPTLLQILVGGCQ